VAKLKDSRGRGLKVGARVRGYFPNLTEIEIHGIVREIAETEKYGPVLEIEEIRTGNIQHLPAANCRRCYGDTKATKAKKTAKKKRKGKK
jgi:hypothetical protein